MATTPTLRKTVGTVAITCAILLALCFVGLYLIEDRIANFNARFADEIQLGLMLFALWLLVSTGIRTVHGKQPEVPFHTLLLVGMLVAIGGALLYLGFLSVSGAVAKSGNGNEVLTASGKIMGFAAGVAFLISLLISINLKVVSKLLGNVLEIAVVVLLGALLFYLSR